MIRLPPLNLFFYNIIISFLDCQYKRTMGGPPLPQLSFWHSVPIINSFLDYPEPIFDYPEPTDIIPDVNPYVNALILLPAIFKHKYLKVVDALVIVWNLFVCKRIVICYVSFLISLWAGDFSLIKFLATLISGVSMSLAHIGLMYYTAKQSLRH